MADFGLARVRILLQQPKGAGNHARRAEAALQPVMFAERLLQRVQAAVGAGQPFDRNDVGAMRLCHEHGAGFHRLPVHVHGTGAAMTGVAADVRTGDPELFAQYMDKQHPRLGENFDLSSVDPQSGLHFGHCHLPRSAGALFGAG
jgi:hypothetical protein